MLPPENNRSQDTNRKEKDQSKVFEDADSFNFLSTWKFQRVHFWSILFLLQGYLEERKNNSDTQTHSTKCIIHRNDK